MLKLMRKKGFAKKMIWAIAIVIIFSFGFFGTAYLVTGNSSPRYAGKIFGKKISVEDFNKVYKNARTQAVRQYGYNLNKVAHLLNLEAKTWDILILLREVKKRKINVSNNKIITAIEEDNSFQKNGQFDILLYNTILRNLQIRPRDYEESVRDNLKIAELYKQITSSVVLSEEDVFKEYRNRNEKTQVSYVLVLSGSFSKDVVPDASKIEQYYQNNKPEFLVPPSVNVQYLTLDFPELNESAENPETEIDNNENQEAKLEEEKDIIREKADAIVQELLINPDMEKIAKKHNLEAKISGFFSMEQPNLTLGWSYDLLNRIFQMDLGEASEPIETTTGLSIVQIKEKRESYIPQFSEVQDKVRAAVAGEIAKNVALKKTQKYRETIKEDLNKTKLRDFPKAAKALELEIHQTPVFSRGQYLPQIGISKEFQEAAFALTEENDLSDVVEITNGYCILSLDSYIPVEENEYEKVKEELALTISQEKQNAVFGGFVAQLRIQSGLIDNIPELKSQTE